jgi:predicted nucleic acid-binding protein
MNGAAEKFFLDTNILLYWLDAANGSKHASAREWVAAVWESGRGAISWQVLNEFYANATRKLGHPRPGVRALVEVYSQWEPVGFELPMLRRAWYWTDHASLAYWDALILAAAESTGCTYLLSEDFQTGRRFGDLTVVNPFLTGPEGFDLR